MSKAKNPAIEPALNHQPAQNLPKVKNPLPSQGLQTATKTNIAEVSYETRMQHLREHENRWRKRLQQTGSGGTGFSHGGYSGSGFS